MIITYVNGYTGSSHGIDGIASSRKHGHDALNITDDIENEIVSIASANPRDRAGQRMRYIAHANIGN